MFQRSHLAGFKIETLSQTHIHTHIHTQRERKKQDKFGYLEIKNYSRQSEMKTTSNMTNILKIYFLGTKSISSTCFDDNTGNYDFTIKGYLLWETLLTRTFLYKSGLEIRNFEIMQMFLKFDNGNKFVFIFEIFNNQTLTYSTCKQ